MIVIAWNPCESGAIVRLSGGEGFGARSKSDTAMSLQYPKVKSGEEEKYHTTKPELNRIKQISVGV
jgi:hypothetical protein